MRDIVVVDLNRLVPVRRAAGRVQQCDVVGFRELLVGCSRQLAEAHREDGSTQRMLERLPGAEVGRERKRADHLGGADRLLC